MDWNALFPILDKYFNADRCLEKVTKIWETDHLISYDRFEETAQYCADSMKASGLVQIEKLPLRADGKTCYNDWKIPKAWKVHHATLCYSDGEAIADYERIPCSLSMYSPATPGPVESEVVDVCGLESFPADGSLKGKILLTDRRAGAAVEEAHKAGAIGVLSCSVTLYPGIRTREDIYDTVLWESMGQRNLTNPVFGFKLTPRQTDEMRKRLAQGPVRVVADIQTEFYDGVKYTVSGLLEGTAPDLPEVFAYGHLYEPGANDNASGSGALLELAQCFREAIDAGDLPRPKRSIRFVMGEECGGSMGYTAAHPDRNMLCGGVFDMVGTEGIDKARLSLRYDPMANLSFADAALDTSVRLHGEFTGQDHDFDRHPFKKSLGTDNIIADPCFGAPSIALVAAPATSYHSSMDTPDRIEMDILKRNALILGVYLYGLADADGDTCRMLEAELRQQTLAELATQTHPKKQQHIREGLERALYSLTKICSELPYKKPVEEIPAIPSYAAEAGHRIPVRLVRGPLTLARHPELKNPRWKPAWNAVLNIPLFWADGKRNLWQVAYQTACELDDVTDEQLQKKYEDTLDYFNFLAELGYITWKEYGQAI